MTGTTWDKSKLEISQNFVAFSEYMNFISGNSQNPVFRPYIEDVLDLFELTKNYETIMFGETATTYYTNYYVQSAIRHR